MRFEASVLITSFGYLHGPPPAATMVLDVREHLRDPHVSPALREMTGRDPMVQAKVMGTPGALGVIDGMVRAVSALIERGHDSLVHLAVGCAGGRHRSVVLADTIARHLDEAGWPVRVEHRDLRRPVVHR